MSHTLLNKNVLMQHACINYLSADKMEQIMHVYSSYTASSNMPSLCSIYSIHNGLLGKCMTCAFRVYNIYIEFKAEGDLLIPSFCLLCTCGIHIQFVCIDSYSLPKQSANLKAMLSQYI